MQYYRKLDGLRAVAIIAVIIHHWGSENFLLNKYLPLGFLGVNLFFVLSGFLITQILLNARENNEIKHGSFTFTLKNFFIRRALRIFPLYYLTLGVFIALDIDNAQNDFIHHVFYLSNWKFFFQNAMQGGLSPRWTLAVEEQFYLILPWIVLFVSRRWLNKVLLFLILSASVWRLYLCIIVPENDLIQFTTFANFDSLVLGALLASVSNSKVLNKNVNIVTVSSVLIGLLLIISLPFLMQEKMLVIENVLGNFIVIQLKAIGSSLVSFSLVLCIISNINLGLLGKLMGSHLLVYLGKISYGLYLYHSMVFRVASKLYPSYSSTLTYEYRMVIGFAVLLFIASVSYHFFELPINKLKIYYPYFKVSQSKLKPI